MLLSENAHYETRDRHRINAGLHYGERCHWPTLVLFASLQSQPH